MIPLKDKVNVNAPVGTYPFGTSPFGTLRNNPGDNSGTPVDVDLVQDLMIFAEALMASGGVTPNGVLDTGGIPQLLQALGNIINTNIAATVATETDAGIAELATQAETNAGTDDERIVTALKLFGWFNDKFGAWTLRSNTGDVVPSTVSGTAIISSNIKYKVIGKTMHIAFKFTSTNTTGSAYYEILIPDSKTCNIGFEFAMKGSFSTVADGNVGSVIGITVAAPTKITVVPTPGTTAASPVTAEGYITFEIA